MNVTPKKWFVLAVAGYCLVNLPAVNSNARLSATDFQTKAVFELAIESSKILKPGTSKIVAQSAFVTLAHGLIPGNSDGLEIQFFTKPITEEGQADILKNDAKELQRSDYATLVLFMDKDKKIWQVNSSYVIPGTTVARTVAWKPDELQKYFSNYKFDGKRLILKTNGSYRESGEETMKLSWNVDLNLPVFREVKR